jgi:hypothetical protein
LKGDDYMDGTSFPHGLADKNNTLIVSDLSTVTQTSAAEDADHTKIVADITSLTAQVNKLKAIVEKILGT